MGMFLAFLTVLVATLTPVAEAKINKFAKVTDSIYRGAQPEDKTDYAILQKLGVRTILNLRTETEIIAQETSLAAEYGIRVISLPMNGFFSPRTATVKTALRDLDDPNLQPVFVHCQYGKDRTGLIIGLHRVFAEGWLKERAYREMRHFGFEPLLLGLSHYFWESTEDRPLTAELATH